MVHVVNYVRTAMSDCLVSIKSFSLSQWRSEGGAGGGICPRAPPGGGRQNHAKEFF